MSRLNLPTDILSQVENLHNDDDDLFDNLTYGAYKMKAKMPMKKSMMKDNDMDDETYKSNKSTAKRKAMLKDPATDTYGIDMIAMDKKAAVRKSLKKG